METRIGALTVELSGAENSKFTAPLLLLHGLWCGADVWRRYAGFLAHRGWACHALNLRGRRDAPAARRLEDYELDVRQAIAAMSGPPVIVGHDVGGLLALRAAAAARAVVALAPYVPQPLAAPTRCVRGTARLALLLGRAVRAPRARGGRLYIGDSALSLVSEPSAVLRALMHDAIELAATATPTLIVVGGRDPFVPITAANTLARHLGATLSVDSCAGHPLPVAAGWERRVGEMHRWLIQQLGDPLLALREESEEDD